MSGRKLMRLGLAAAVLLALPAVAQDGGGPGSGGPGSDGPLPFDALPADASAPLGGMAVSPTRVVLEAGGRGATLTLYNSGASAVTYRIDEVELGLDADGNYRQLAEDEAAPWAATPYLRYSPRQVTLQPGQRQSVRIIARAPRDLPAGELRSHLSVSTIPLVAPVSDTPEQADEAGDNRTVEVRVGLEYRITIPVLLRTGSPQGGSAITAAVIDTSGSQPALKVTLARTGVRSDYGVVRVFDAAGDEIGLLRGIAVLPPAPTRTVRVPLQGNGQPARVTYSEDDVGGRKGALLADLALP